MKTALLVKIARGQRVRSASQAGYSMEFSDLLDGIDPKPTAVAISLPDPIPAELDLGLADLVMFPVPHRFDPEPDPVVEPVDEPVAELIEEPVAEPAKVSRFAGNGLDDDLLPVRAPRRRLHR